ncbi:MAG: lysophospholipid acyltransferase family protein [Candidatus Micropelagos thuwalensis]|nr:lysophospholipid acyltransferase family protein [Candidatus Micropelagos thuwalensis]
MLKTFRHVIEFISGMAFIKLSRLMGLERSSQFFGHLFSKIGPRLPQNKIAVRNLTAIFQEADEAEIKSLNIEMWRNLGMFFGEFSNLDRLRAEADTRINISGWNLTQKTFDEGRGLIFFSGHMGNWEVMAAATHIFDNDVMGVYRKANNPFFEKWITKIRNKSTVTKLVQKGADGAKNIIKTLKAGNTVCVLNDQKMNDGAELKFFNRRAMTATAIPKIARKFNIPMVFVSVQRRENSHFDVVFHPPFLPEITEDAHQDILNTAQKMNDILEEAIKQQPAHWLWLHNRWK